MNCKLSPGTEVTFQKSEGSDDFSATGVVAVDDGVHVAIKRPDGETVIRQWGRLRELRVPPAKGQSL